MPKITDAEIQRLAERFVQWPLPHDVCADPSVIRPGSHRTGTNLLTVAQAEGMIRYLLDPDFSGAWCSQCQAYRPHHGDPDSIHLHLCDTCKGVVDY